MRSTWFSSKDPAGRRGAVRLNQQAGRGRCGAVPAALGACALSLGLFGLPGSAQAAGYANGDQSPAGVALAGAMTARADDASAIYYNPAGLGFQSGLSVLAGVTLISPNQSVTDASGATFNTKSQLFVLPTIFAAARVSERVSFGLGAYVRHATGIDWRNPDNKGVFPGRYKAENVALQSFTFSPTMAIRPISQLSLAFGLNIETGSLELERSLNLGSSDGHIALSGGALNASATVGALLRLLDGRLNFGLNYRSASTLRFEKMALGITSPSNVALHLPYTKGETELPTPHTISVGVAGKPLPWLTVSADYIATLWSSVREQRITLSSDDNHTQTQIIPRAWSDASSGRLGLEADLRTFLPKSKLWPKIRVGFGYDQSPVPSSTLEPSAPDADRILPSVGFALGLRGVGSIEASYSAVIFSQRTSENPDLRLTYNGTLHVISAALNLQLERVFGTHSAPYSARLLDRTADLPPSS